MENASGFERHVISLVRLDTLSIISSKARDLSVNLIDGKHNIYDRKLFDLLVVHESLITKNWAASWQNQQSDCAPSEDTDQPGHPSSLIRVFAVRSLGN